MKKNPAVTEDSTMSHRMTPIAVVGMGALFPGSTTTLGFWRDIVEGRDRLTEVPRTHWLREDYFDARPGTPDKVYATRGGFMPPIDFSPLEFGMPPNAVPSTDTAQLLALVVAKRVLEEATRGKYETVDRSRMSVVLGVASATELVAHMSGRLQRPVWEYAMRQAGLDESEVERVSKVLEGCYVPWQESTFPGLLGNVVAGRITNRLDLGGTNLVVDAACGGSLAAITTAANDLALGNSDLVITGGVDALNDILMYMCFAQTGALSVSGDCRPFSDQSDGTMLGEGIGMLALRRLDDAERDGDAIYAVIRGIGSSSDGRAKSIYAPSAQGQTLALRRAYEHAGYGPETVGLVEAHGTGTVAGDAAEVEALRMVFEEAKAPIGGCALGSVKAQLGHTKAAAGSAGMIKAVLALHHKILPPTIKVRAPNPKLALEGSPFYLNTETRPWVHEGAHPRRASVSALGFGGTNFHVTLEEYVGPSEHPARMHTLPSELVLLTASSPAALVAACRETAAACSAEGALVHLAKRTQLAFDASAPARVSIVATDEADAREKLAIAAESIEKSSKSGATSFTSPRGIVYGTGAPEGGVAFLFPGQGSQYVGMGAELAMHFDCVREVWDRAKATVRSADGKESLAERVFPRPVFDEEARASLDKKLTATEWAQPAITATSLGMMRLLESVGLKPAAVGGHSLGEVTAAVAAGMFDEHTGLEVARRRGELMAKASETPGAMTAAASDPATVARVVAGIDVVLANHNSPLQVVLSGSVSEIERAERSLEAAKITVRRLPVATAFHSPLVQASVEPFGAFLAGVTASPPRLPYYANATAALYPEDPVAARAQLAGAIALPVRFVDQIEAMYAAGIRTFVEVGPDAVLSRLTERCLVGRTHLAVALDQRGKHGLTAFLMALGRLAAAGVPLAFASLWEGQKLPDDPATKPAAKFSIKLSGANYGKPYPPADPSAPVKRVAPVAPVAAATPAKAVESPAKAPAAVVAQAPTPPREIVTSTPTLRAAAPEAAPAKPEAAPHAASTPVHMQNTPVRGMPTISTDSADWVESLQRLQAPAIAAQMEFQRLMAESHMAFLRAVESSYTSVSPGAPFAVAEPALSAPSRPVLPAVDVRPPAPVAAPRPAAPVPVEAERLAPVAAAPVAPPPAAPPPAAPPAAVAQAASPARKTADLTPILLAIVAEKTGYPEEMIDTAMDMEADLGIDSIKRVEILSAMRQSVPDLPQVNTAKMAAMRTLAQIIELMGGAANGTTAAPAVSVPEAQAATVAAPSRVAELQPILLSIVAEKTGYPVEMIDTGMDMEADLGIDSIKRVEILSAMRQSVPDLPQVATAKMAAMRTLAQIIELMGGAVASGAPASPPVAAVAAPAPVAAPSRIAELQPILLSIVAEKTGYPVEMIDTGMDMEADLGIDSIKRVEILSAMRQSVPDLPQVATAKMAAMRTLGQIIELMGAGAAPVASAPLAPVAPAPVASAPVAAPSRVAELQPILLSIVAEKTGYPVEMIDTGMDMEADLGIDSIKRVEILSAMRQSVPDLPQVPTAKMAAMRTLAQIIELMGGSGGATSATSATPNSGVNVAPVAAPTKTVAPLAPVARIAVRAVAAPALGFAVPGLFRGPIVVTPDGGGVARALVERLRARGVDAAMATVDAIPESACGVLFLGGLRPVVDEAAMAVNREAFGAARAVAARFREHGGLFVTVQDTGGDFGLTGRESGRAWLAGIAALAKTAGDEWPLATTKAIDLERAGRPDGDLADALVAELLAGGPEVEVGLGATGARITLVGVPCPVKAGSRPVAEGAVFVVTGGARGVTASSLVELGRVARPRVLILGRTPLVDEPAAFRGVADEPGLKRIALTEAKRVGRAVTPKEIGAEVDKILAGREVRDTLARLEATGSLVRYEAVDVRDPVALRALLEDVRRTWGAIHGLVHGAGVLADAFIDKKTDAQFDRVFDTKVAGLRALLEATQTDPLEWICLFSSVAARGGNAGQSDYAMANEVLNKIAAVEARRRDGRCRVCAIGWGPWDGGMVTPALRSHFLERGVALLPVREGADAFVKELSAAPSDDVEVVIGGGDAGLHAADAPSVRARAEVLVSAATHPQLASHRIQGKPVLPMVLALEWFARLARAAFPERASVQLRDVRVVRGVTLAGFDGAGDRFTLSATAGKSGVGLELRDAAGAVRYSATIEPSTTRAAAEPLNGAELGESPWEKADIYSPKTLFHGNDFQVIRSIDGLSPRGARATLSGTSDVGWPSEAWETDPAAVDGALQLAILCGLHALGPTLPLRIGKIGYAGQAVAGPIRCALFVRSQTPERVVCDIALAGSDGAPIADLVDVEMYAVPSGTTSATATA